MRAWSTPLSRGKRLSQIAQEREAFPGQAHVLVFLANAPTSAVRDLIRRAGVRLLDPVSSHAWHASFDPQGVAAQAVDSGNNLALSSLGIQAIGEPEPRLKLNSTLREGVPPRWATAEIESVPAVDVQIVYHADATTAGVPAALKKLGAINITIDRYFERVSARVPLDRLLGVASLDWVRYVDAIPAPARANDNAASGIQIHVSDIQAAPLNLTGDGVKIAVVDEGRIFRHVEFGDRLTVVDNVGLNTHSTHVAGTIAAAGTNDPRIKGMAPKSQLFSYTFLGDQPAKMLAARRDYGVEAVNNSWGADITESNGNCNLFGDYGVRERDLDRLVRQEKLSIVFSMGNSRDDPTCAIPPRAGFSTTGRPASAKNVISVGAVDSGAAAAYFSSYGPAKDGRLKPEITAPGVSVRSTSTTNGTLVLSGTSMSAPAITGMLALLIERFRQLNGGASPDPALLKAVLLNTADDLGNPGPDYTFGFGQANALNAVAVINETRWARGQVAGGATAGHSIEVGPGSQTLRVLLNYSDREASGESLRVLIQNLDLRLTSPDGQTRVLPLTLDPDYPNRDAVAGVNSRDPVEQVMIQNPAPGSWKAEVVGTDLPAGEQEYFLTWDMTPVGIPACTSSVTPPSIRVTQEAGIAAIAVTRPNQCGLWEIETFNAPWLSVRPSSLPYGSGVLKVDYQANLLDGARSGLVRVSGSNVSVIQNAACVSTEIPDNLPISASLTSRDCLLDTGQFVRRYRFTAQSGQFVSIEMGSNTFDTYLELWTADGILIARDDDGGGGTNSRIPPTRGGMLLPYSGEYVIWATSFDPQETGSFTLKRQFVEGAVNPETLPRPVSSCPASLDGELVAADGRAGRRGDFFPTDVFVFPGRVGQSVTVELAAAFDSVLYLIAPSGRLVAFNDDAPGASSRISATTLLETGPWRAEVAGFSPTDTGTYRLSIQGCSEAAPTASQ